MREIKFRAWDVKRKLMMYDDASGRHDVGYWDGIECSTVEMVNAQLKPEPFEWMQFTGLFDENGIEIYEGDVVRMPMFYDDEPLSHDYGVIIYSQACWYLELNEDSAIPLQSCDKIEVIGNIYENTELIKEKK